MDSILKNVAGADECMRDEWVLPNGLRVLGERLPHLRSVSIGAWMHVGSMMETPEENGLSHFIEHMIFKGTTRRTVRQIAEEMDAVGGQLNAFTGKDCTCCYAKVIDEDIELAIDIIADMVMNATMDEKELDKERWKKSRWTRIRPKIWCMTCWRRRSSARSRWGSRFWGRRNRWRRTPAPT